MTVKRRFKTLMLRKQQRQSEREAEIAEKNNQLKLGPTSNPKEEIEGVMKSQQSSGGGGKSQLDLNIRPHPHVSMMSLLQAANQPLETYMKQNGLTTLIPEPQGTSSGSQPLPQQQASSTAQDEQNNQNSS